jgi:hypothetical protein
MTIFASRSVSFPPGAHQKTAPHNALNSIAPAWTEHQVHCNTTTTLMSSGHHTASSPARATISSLARFIIAAALLQKRRGRHHCCAPRTPLPSPANHYAAPLWTINAICAALQCIPEHAVQETNYFDWPNDNQCFMWYQQRHYLCRSNDLSGWDFFFSSSWIFVSSAPACREVIWCGHALVIQPKYTHAASATATPERERDSSLKEDSCAQNSLLLRTLKIVRAPRANE